MLELRNIGMVDVDVEVKWTSSYCRRFSGATIQGDISGNYATGSVAGSSDRVGGLVGFKL